MCLISGAVRVQTPLFLPRNRKLYDGIELACFMDHSGMLVTLPYDLRVSLTHTRSLVYVSTHAHRAPIIKLFTQEHANTHTQCEAAISSRLKIPLPQEPRGPNACFHTLITAWYAQTSLSLYKCTQCLNSCFFPPSSLDRVCKIRRSQQCNTSETVKFILRSHFDHLCAHK